MDSEKNRYTISSVIRALRVLKLFDRNHRSISLTEISAMSGLTKSSALRIMESLESEGFVKRIDNSKKYKLGLELYMISKEGYDFSSLQAVAEPNTVPSLRFLSPFPGAKYTGLAWAFHPENTCSKAPLPPVLPGPWPRLHQ